MSSPTDLPPPSRDTVEPVSLKVKPPGAAAPGPTPPSRDDQLRKFTIVGFVVLALLAVGVFFLLPSAVERGTEREEQTAEAVEIESEVEPTPPRPALDPEDPETRAAQSAAEESLTDFVALEARLKAQDVEAWASEAFAEAQARAREAERMLRDRDTVDAATRMGEAVAQLEALEERAQLLFEEALRNGAVALSAGDADDARDQFGRAARIRPEDPSAANGLRRAETIEEAFALLREGNELEEAGDIAAARERYVEGIALDPELQAFSTARARVDEALTREAFQQAMSRGFSAYGRGEYAAAIGAFREALTLRPSAPSALDGLAQAQEAARDQRVSEHRTQAEGFEVEERWHDAVKEYEAALALDPGVGFAQQGLALSKRRARLSDALEFYISKPGRLSEESVRAEAGRTLEQADAVAHPGPVLRNQIDRVAALLNEMSTPVAVELLSDAQTDVLLYHVGRLGRFEARRVELTPGRYTIVGTRAGYRDVRTQFTVSAGASPPPITVRCEEKI